MAQGYFEIRFRKDDGSNDVELMEKVIDWCKSNYEWFQEGIDDGQINADGVIESVNNNGLVESEVPDEALEEDFIEEIFNEFKPLDMKAVQILGEGEYGDAPYSYNKWIIVCDNGEPRLRGRSSGWDWGNEACVECDSGPNGPFLEQSETLGQYYAEFINKVNGKTSKCYVVTCEDELSLQFNSYLIDDEDQRTGYLDYFDHFDDNLLSAMEDGCSEWEGTDDDKNVDNWEFKGFKADDFWTDGKM